MPKYIFKNLICRWGIYLDVPEALIRILNLKKVSYFYFHRFRFRSMYALFLIARNVLLFLKIFLKFQKYLNIFHYV